MTTLRSFYFGLVWDIFVVIVRSMAICVESTCIDANDSSLWVIFVLGLFSLSGTSRIDTAGL